MKLLVDRPHVLALAEAFPALAGLAEQLRFGHRVELAATALPADALQFLARRYEDAGHTLQGRAAQLRSLAAVLSADEPRFGPGSEVEQLLPALVRHLADGAIRGWLFQADADGKPLPWVITRIDYVARSQEENAKLMLELKANTRATVATQLLRLAEVDLRAAGPQGLGIGGLLAAKGWLKETPQLMAAYDAAAARYFDWRGRYGMQCAGQGTGLHAEDPSATRRDTDWSRKERIVLSSSGGEARLVNDEGVLPPRSTTLDSPGAVLGPYLRRAGKSSDYDCEDEVRGLREALPEGLFTELPVHAYLFMFHLELHQHLWVHADGA